jgi:hypothetical protein
MSYTKNIIAIMVLASMIVSQMPAMQVPSGNKALIISGAACLGSAAIVKMCRDLAIRFDEQYDRDNENYEGSRPAKENLVWSKYAEEEPNKQI